MPRPVVPTSRERTAGLELFYTDTPPLGGRLRTFPEDFVVEETGPPPRVAPSGKQLALRVRLHNWEHNHFVRDLSRQLRTSRNNIGFSGTKDKRAVTTQWITVKSDFADEDALHRTRSMPRVEVLAHHRTEKRLRLGQHVGNRFTITMRGIERTEQEAHTLLHETMTSLRGLGGAPNFFGIQRFGAVRPITHRIGERLIRGEIREAVIDYITTTAPEEHENTTAGRRRVGETLDWKEALAVLPTNLKFERAVAQRLMERPGDWVGAIKVLPANLLTLMVFAYQSYLFNRMLSARIAAGLPIHRALIGDLVIPMVDGAAQDQRAPVPVTAGNVDKVNRQLAHGRGAVSGPLFGHGTALADGEPGEIERRILAEEKVEREMFHNEQIPELTSTGIRRALLVPLSGLTWSVGPDMMQTGKVAATFAFTLGKGSYATAVLREIMKAEDTTTY